MGLGGIGGPGDRGSRGQPGGGGGSRGNNPGGGTATGGGGPPRRAKRTTPTRTARENMATRLATGGNQGNQDTFRRTPGTTQQIAERAIPTGDDPGALRLAPGIGSVVSIGSTIADWARESGREVNDPRYDARGRPGLGRDSQEGERLRLQRGAASRSITPAAGDSMVTGGSDELAGQGSEGTGTRTRRTVLGRLNLRRPMLSSRRGATFLG